MPNSLEGDYLPLLEAVAFAGRAHRHQLRKDGLTPYVSHAYRVCLVMRHVFDIDDPQLLMAAVLHDTVEDTTTDHDDLAEHFGKEVADWVALLSKDKRLSETEREQAYCAQLAAAPWQVKVCKLADIFDNLMDSPDTRPQLRARTLRNSHRYLDALKPLLPEEARRPFKIVAELLATLEAQKSDHGDIVHLD
jgi:guanosine-3',5'-bis(diphosphate) 3'-pyrophosphohydrolase